MLTFNEESCQCRRRLNKPTIRHSCLPDIRQLQAKSRLNVEICSICGFTSKRLCYRTGLSVLKSKGGKTMTNVGSTLVCVSLSCPHRTMQLLRENKKIQVHISFIAPLVGNLALVSTNAACCSPTPHPHIKGH